MILAQCTAMQVRIDGFKAIAAVFMQASFYAIAVYEQMEMGDGHAYCHHHLKRIQVSFEQHRQKIFGGFGLKAVLLNGQHPVLMVVREFPQTLPDAIKR